MKKFSEGRTEGLARSSALLAILLLYAMVWGFAGISKLRLGIPDWWKEKFGATFFAHFPGLTATFWILTVSELIGFSLAVAGVVRLEFLERKSPRISVACLVWSLFVFLQLGFGQWLTLEFNGAFQQFAYFGVTLGCLRVLAPDVCRPEPTRG